jgi:hypothetical protein
LDPVQVLSEKRYCKQRNHRTVLPSPCPVLKTEGV